MKVLFDTNILLDVLLKRMPHVLNRAVLTAALALDFDDYEDAVVHEAAVAVDADAIVTRNGADFAGSAVPIFTPGELLAAIAVL